MLNKVSEQDVKNFLFQEMSNQRTKRNRITVHNILFLEAEKDYKQAGHPIWDRKWDRPNPTGEDSPSKPLPESPEEITPTIPQEDKSVLKSTPGLQYVQKKKNTGRRLFVDRLGSIEERLQKAANKLDQCGATAVANKIDKLLQRIHEENNVRKES